MRIKSLLGSCCLSLCFLFIQAHPGIGLVYDGDHTIFYTDLNHVWQLDTHTGQSRIYVENVHSHELALDAVGNLYGEHFWYVESQDVFKNYIWRVDAMGNFQKIRQEQPGENLDFSFVRDHAFTSYTLRARNDLFEIVKKDSGSYAVWHEIELGIPGWGYVTQNGDFLFSDYPRIYAANAEEVKVIAEDLSASRIPFSLQDKTHHIYGIWTDQAGLVYAALYGGRQVVRIDAGGTPVRVLSTGPLWSPVNGLFDKDKQLWLLEARMDGAVRLRKIEMSQLGKDTSFSRDIVVLFLALLIILGVVLLIRNNIRRNRPKTKNPI